MIKIILNNSSSNPTSPLFIRFGDDGLDKEEVGIEMLCAFGSSIKINSLCTLVHSHVHSLPNIIQMPCSLSENYQNIVVLEWPTIMSYVMSAASPSWSVNQLNVFERTSYWGTHLLAVFETSQHWQQTAETSQSLMVYYGPTDRQYICVKTSAPHKGKLIVRFKSKVVGPVGVINFNLFAPEEFCFWGLPGGPIRSDDDIPPIDKKIPIEPQLQRYYIMQPVTSCNRVTDDLKILISSINITWLRGQFAATGNIKFSSRIDMERAIGQQLKLVINGYEFIVICEQPSTSNRFANNSYSASIRSRFAELAAPYQRERNYVNTVDKTLAGIMTDILENTGWTLDNKMIDYPIPEGAFSYRGLTPAAALLKVASSIGAILDINDTTKTVSVVPEWPVNPWSTEQATPDVILNDALILEHNTQDTIQPAHNVVFVRGEQQGVACKIKRQGTPATDYARDIVDNLITDVQAARQRGTCELARSGNKRTATIRTKLKADLPPIRPGMLLGVRFEDELYKATVDSLAISASISNQGAIMVNQTIQAVRNV
ncbi:hypothetical protein ACSLBF_10570 [Pseudoalteromonas sp. T1lg65]|uniref:hypothetical protein n=1 Tax=Pseudoalteromonas sp. T1lg65 TaxID=2077101 RepID=UPI003F7AF690